MKDKQIKQILSKLKEQALLAKDKNSHHEIFNVMYGFVEIIENDPVFSKFISTKITEEGKIHGYLNDAVKRQEISKEEHYKKFQIHIAHAFYHSCYSLIKAAHDCIKIDKCAALGIKGKNIYMPGLFFFSTDNPKFSERLERHEKIDYLQDFNLCLKKIRELIDTDRDLLNKIYKEVNEDKAEKKNDNIKINNNISFKYNNIDKIGSIYFKDERISFQGRRALIINYFFNKEEKGQVNYHNFIKWLKNEKIKNIRAESFNFRQDIVKINKRMEKESKYIKSLIFKVKKSPKKPTEINNYMEYYNNGRYQRDIKKMTPVQYRNHLLETT